MRLAFSLYPSLSLHTQTHTRTHQTPLPLFLSLHPSLPPSVSAAIAASAVRDPCAPAGAGTPAGRYPQQTAPAQEQQARKCGVGMMLNFDATSREFVVTGPVGTRARTQAHTCTYKTKPSTQLQHRNPIKLSRTAPSWPHVCVCMCVCARLLAGKC
jgi:hypothetical protein